MGLHCPILAPTWNIIKQYKLKKIDEEEYSTLYINILKARELTPEGIYDALPDQTVLLCYEKPGDFCHRRVLANWIEQSIDVKIPEWKSEKEVNKLVVVDSLLNF
jgi:uncharacterized protein YeaO (DUF488 family)